ncbi:hypothetical protein L2E82_47610 [Cichorium intybus]|uniref:Uncharacterized protein n=1 Tax=Cichorium intybus TaxID=13427 RepID=A0ACB8YW28_CICIN|nr:hypothetical protein L2E82_47610 [Cichorium intybus]
MFNYPFMILCLFYGKIRFTIRLHTLTLNSFNPDISRMQVAATFSFRFLGSQLHSLPSICQAAISSVSIRYLRSTKPPFPRFTAPFQRLLLSLPPSPTGYPATFSPPIHHSYLNRI